MSKIFRSTESSQFSALRVNGQSTYRTRLETDRGLRELAHRCDGGLEVALFWHPSRGERAVEVALSVLE